MLSWCHGCRGCVWGWWCPKAQLVYKEVVGLGRLLLAGHQSLHLKRDREILQYWPRRFVYYLKHLTILYFHESLKRIKCCYGVMDVEDVYGAGRDPLREGP